VKKTRVIRISAFAPTLEQLQELKKAFGTDVEVTTVGGMPSAPVEFENWYKKLVADECVKGVEFPPNTPIELLDIAEDMDRDRRWFNHHLQPVFVFSHYETVSLQGNIMKKRLK